MSEVVNTMGSNEYHGQISILKILYISVNIVNKDLVSEGLDYAEVFYWTLVTFREKIANVNFLYSHPLIHSLQLQLRTACASWVLLAIAPCVQN
jgi:hypothetical protein